MAIDVIVTTWGAGVWRERGEQTARANDAWHYHHDDLWCTAGAARNAALLSVGAEDWICFLDADDDLGPDYLGAMEAAYDHPGQLLTPALKLGDTPARTLNDRDIINGSNPCPIGTLIHRDLFDAVGGFGGEPAWEDFAMFQRAVLIGAQIKFVPDAIYVAAHNPRGRNSTVRNPKWLRRQIQADNQRWLMSR